MPPSSRWIRWIRTLILLSGDRGFTEKGLVFEYLEGDCEEKFREGGQSVATEQGFQEAECKGLTEVESQRRENRAAQNRGRALGRSHGPEKGKP